MKYIIIIGLFGMGFVHGYAQTLSLDYRNDSVIYNKDQQGNTMLDFSYCGYRNSESSLPNAVNKVFVSWKEGDNHKRIQDAVDYVSSLKPDKTGLRGAILLDEGVFEISKSIFIKSTGVVLRGKDKNNTIILKKGFDRGAAIYIEGINDIEYSDTIKIIDEYIPLNSRCLKADINQGQINSTDIFIIRPSIKEWIESISCTSHGGGINALGWKPGDADLRWDRKIDASEKGVVKLNSPLTLALNKSEGESYIIPYTWEGRISDCGIENLSLLSDYDKENPKDEDHCWTGISIDNTQNSWVRNINFSHFAGSAVVLLSGSSKITVEDCISTNPVSEIGGMRRQTYLTMGQENLFQRCYAENGINDFIAGYNAAGPNAFVQCESKYPNGFSGSLGPWTPGLLFDIVDIEGDDIKLKNLGQNKNGAGWNTANSLIWQCTAAEIECYSPSENGGNYAFGCWAQFSGNGIWKQSNSHINPRSIFYAQLKQRLNKDVSSQAKILPLNTKTTSSPTIEEAVFMAEEATKTRLQLVAQIAETKLNCNFDSRRLISVDKIQKKSFESHVSDSNSQKGVEIINGQIYYNDTILSGNKLDISWWNGNLRNSSISKAKPHITRFVPGMEGQGLTDRIDSVIHYLKKDNIAILDHNYGLWYDRRRDDHLRVKRKDGDVWAPFYEQPFARSGIGTSWDGLSKYDLTKPNKWYWQRLKEFADKGETNGIILFNQHYFQHNILEAGAHWVDSPWRTANNINNTGFAEPVNFTGDKRIFVADDFYDISHPVRRELHRNYIRYSLDAFSDNSNVIHFISFEYTGPLHFVEFWLDVIKEWQNETGKKANIAISATKDVQDKILENPLYSKLIDIIDIRYWHYNTEGLYAPPGNANLAPRQHARKMKQGTVTYNEVYKAVKEYKDRYPEKAVVYFSLGYKNYGNAISDAGGSLFVPYDIKEPKRR